MPKPKKTPITPLDRYFEGYDKASLQAALETLQDTFAWELFSSYLQARQREFEVAALDLMGHTGREHEAAKASGYALGMEDVAEHLIPEFIALLSGKTGIYEQPRPEETN